MINMFVYLLNLHFEQNIVVLNWKLIFEQLYSNRTLAAKYDELSKDIVKEVKSTIDDSRPTKTTFEDKKEEFRKFKVKKHKIVRVNQRDNGETSEPKSDNTFLFHGTNADSAARVLEEGLKKSIEEKLVEKGPSKFDHITFCKLCFLLTF